MPTEVSQAAEPVFDIEIPAMNAAEALNDLAEQTGSVMLFSYDLARARQANAVRGRYTLLEGLELLLRDSGLSGGLSDKRVVIIAESENSPEGKGETVKKRGLLAGLIAAVLGSQATEAGADQEIESKSSTKLEEIIVTAQKREERLIDVPLSMSVLSADELAKSGILQFRDFADTVPGLSYQTTGAGFTEISLRGVTTGRSVSPTVGIYVDEVPYGGSTVFSQASILALDVGLFDLDRIEVLRGPQGTLWGASTMGGLLRYVTNWPDATGFSLDAQTRVSDTRHGGVSYHGVATVNAPIVTDKAALRATGYYSRDGGYIDNVALGKDDVNRSEIYGGRADLLLTPTEALSIRITGFLQDSARDGEGTADYALTGVPLGGSLDQRRLTAEPFDRRFRIVSGTVTYDLDWASLTSISSYQTVRSETAFDLPAFVPFCAFVGRSCSSVGVLNDISTDKFVQEVRLASKGTKPLEWLIGGFYTHESSDFNSELVLRDLAGEPLPNDLLTSMQPSTYEEYAAFGDLTWHLTSKFDVTGGIRYAHNRTKFEQSGSGLFAANRPTRRSSDDVVTYLAHARYHFNDHATGYLRYATGYRPGGPNFVPAGAGLGLETFEADRLKSYEVGFKAETADRRFGIDVAGYYIDWSNIQIAVFRGTFGGIDNAPGGAEVLGAELTLTAHLTPAFTATGAFAYQDPEMSEANPDLGAAKGERLPNVPRWTSALNADYELPWWGSFQPTLGATLRYVDDRMASFDNARGFLQYRVPEYTTVDLRAGFTLGRVDAQIYVRNLFDERGQLSANNFRGAGAQPAILQPRTIGVTLTTHF